MHLFRPLKPGLTVTKGVFLSDRETVRKEPLPVAGRQTLHQLTPEFIFFTPAVLYLIQAMQGDLPWADFNREFNVDATFYHHRFRSAIFTGLDTRDGDKDWNHVLWAVRPHIWAVLAGYATTLTFMHAQPGLFDLTILQAVKIKDALAWDCGNQDTPPLTCIAFTVTGSRQTCAFLGYTEDKRSICRWAGASPKADKLYSNLLQGLPPWTGVE